eukprot:4175876-Alexandrium_andersonii.AAC.1
MSASLVGSEMCIRDRSTPISPGAGSGWRHRPLTPGPGPCSCPPWVSKQPAPAPSSAGLGPVGRRSPGRA